MSREQIIQEISQSLESLTLFQHFKGRIVAKIGEAIHTETGETLILYREYNSVSGTFDEKVWARPMGMFYENQPYKLEPRFKPITPNKAALTIYRYKEQNYLLNTQQK